jgi:hypothetical protein
VIASNVIFTDDGEGNKYYIPEDKMFVWDELVNEYGRDGEEFDTPVWAVLVEGECYIVDIKEKL